MSNPTPDSPATMQPRFYRDFKYKRRLLPNSYVADLERGVNSLEEAGAKTGLTIGFPGWNLLYYCCYCGLKPDGFNAIVETGTNQGFSTIFLAQALIDRGRQGHVYTVELDPENAAKARANFTAAGVADRITLFEGDSLVRLSEIVGNLESIRFAFLDGNHEREHVMKEFEIVLPKLEDKATVFFDNTDYIGQPADDLRVFGALMDIQKKHGGNIVRFPFTSWYTPGQAIWQG